MKKKSTKRKSKFDDLTVEEFVKTIVKSSNLQPILYLDTYISSPRSKAGKLAQAIVKKLNKEELTKIIISMNLFSNFPELLADSIILQTKAAAKSYQGVIKRHEKNKKYLKTQAEKTKKQQELNSKQKAELNILKEELSSEQQKRLKDIFGITFDSKKAAAISHNMLSDHKKIEIVNEEDDEEIY